MISVLKKIKEKENFFCFDLNPDFSEPTISNDNFNVHTWISEIYNKSDVKKSFGLSETRSKLNKAFEKQHERFKK